jgi:hypothetical protein
VRSIKWLLLVGVGCLACARQPRLPAGSRHSATGFLNDSAWFATAKASRVIPAGATPNSVKQFNLQLETDIDYAGNGSVTRSPTVTGCLEDCIPTQRLHIYNIPLKKGKHKLSKLDKRRTSDPEKTSFWLLINGSGAFKTYHLSKHGPSWIRITNYDQQSNTLDGQFAVQLDLNTNSSVTKELKDWYKTDSVARFRQGLFRVKLTDVMLK